MEPSAKVLFTHTDGDGDGIQFITTRRDRLTVGVTERGTASRAYLSRDAAAVCRDALTKWLDESGAAADPGGWKSAVDALNADAVTAEHRAEALRLAVSLAPTNADRHRVFEVAGEFARYLATGEVPPVETPIVAVPQGMTFIDAAPKTDCFCGHPTSAHGRRGCMRWDESGREYCSCERTPGSFDAAHSTAHTDRCQCRGRR